MTPGIEFRLTLIARMTALATIAIAVATLIGWTIGSPTLIQIDPGAAPMQVNTALGFLALGIAALARPRATPSSIVWVLSGAVALLSFATIVQYAFGLDLGIDRLASRHVAMPLESHPGRMSPSCAVGLLLGSIANWPRPRAARPLRIVAVAGAALLGLGGIALFGLATGQRHLAGWGSLAQLAIHTSIAFLLLGTSMLARAASVEFARRAPLVEIPWLPWVASILIAAITAATWVDQRVADEEELHRHHQSLCHALGSATQRSIEDQLGAVELLAARWQLRRPTFAEWVADAQGLLRENRLLENIEWVDPDYRIRWIVPEADGKNLVDFDLRSVPGRREELDESLVTRTPRLTTAAELARGGRGFQALMPLFRDNAADGFLVAVSSFAHILDLLQELSSEPIGLALQWHGADLASRGDTRNADRWSAATRMDLHGLGVGLRIWPLQLALRGAATFLFSGFLVALALGSALRSLQQGRIRNRQLDTTIDAAPVGMMLVDAEGHIRRVNAVARQTFGLGSNANGMCVDDLVPARARAAHAELRARYLTDAQSRRMGFGRDLTGRRRDGSEFPVEIALAPVPFGNETMTLVIIADISDRKQAERQLAAHTASLAQANEDLAHFAYIASHDLRAPLRAIQNLATWISEDLAPSLTPESSEHLTLMRQRVARMDALLDGLLSYSRVGRTDVALEPVDVGAVLRDIVVMLGPPPGFAVDFREPLPTIETSRAALEQVLLNLIANAIKHHDRASGRIQVEVEDAGDQLRISVTDDGPGIPSDACERVFEMFQTLKPRDEVEGCGMGLALVKKQVGRFGGHVHVEPATDRGARFVFTWNKHATMDVGA